MTDALIRRPRPQAIDAPLTRSAIFLVLTVNDGRDTLEKARDVLSGMEDLVKTVHFRKPENRLSCVTAIGSLLWERFSATWRPAELRPFKPIQGAVHRAPTTPGDLLFHIRSDDAGLCYEFERLLLDAFGDAVEVRDEVVGFRYFDMRDLLGFVDGTANPVGDDIAEAALVGDEDPDFAGGSYVVVQKYLHDLAGWSALPNHVQEAIVGRRKPDNVEIDDDDAPRKSHKSLTTIADEDGNELDILRDNMPFGRPGQKEFGTYFIGYSRRLWVTEKMLERMYVGEPAGAYDRLLDFSIPKTGTTFFAPAREALEKLLGGGST